MRSHLEILTYSMPLLTYPLILQVLTVFFKVSHVLPDSGLQGKEEQTELPFSMASTVLKPELLLCARTLLRREMLNLAVSSQRQFPSPGALGAGLGTGTWLCPSPNSPGLCFSPVLPLCQRTITPFLSSPSASGLQTPSPWR